MAGERLGERIGIREDLIKNACALAFKPQKSPDKHYYLEKIRSSTSEVIISFPATWAVESQFADNEKPFRETSINLNLFPSLRSIGNDEAALVNEAFLLKFEAILSNSSLKSEVNTAMTKGKRIVFTGHSFGAAMAILASLWAMDEYLNPLKNQTHIPPFCVTFGSPLVGNHIFPRATRRENWSRYFIHFVMRFDVLPRILLAPFSSVETLNSILQILKPKSKSSSTHGGSMRREVRYSEFYSSVMRNAAAVTSHAACNLMGSTNLLLETVTNFVDLSPYRPFGTFIFCTGNGKLVVIRNSDAVLQLMFHSALLNNKEESENDEIAKERILQHFAYEDELQGSLEMQDVVYLDQLEELPLSADGSNNDAAIIDMALNDLGLGARARLCIRAAGELEKQKARNEGKIDKEKARDRMKELKEYAEVSKIHGVGYYDAFKQQKDPRDFQANVKRLVLAGVWDEIIEMLKRYELPDEFEGRQEWIDFGTEFRRLVEPLDVANYYRHLKNEDTGPYMMRARPKRYRYTQRWLEHARRMPKGGCSESTFWAEVEELSSRTNKGSFKDMKEQVLKLEQDVKRWTEEEKLPTADFFLEGSTFMKWWKNLPNEYKAGILHC